MHAAAHPEPAALGTRQGDLWLALLVILVYANALGGAFQFDDYNVIVDQEAVHSVAAFRADWGQGIRPLLKLSYLLNWISGWGSAGFHIFNAMVHLAVVLCVYQLGCLLLRARALEQAAPHAALAGAALFACHPAQTEAVTYICGRSTSFMALLFLAGLWAHARAQGPVHRWLPPLCMALALAVKETAVTFPLALLVWDRFNGTPWRAALRRAWRSWSVLMLAALFFLLNDAYRDAMVRSLEFNSLAGNLATQAQAVVYLLRQWAVPLWLNIDPDLPVQHGAAASGLGAIVLLLLVAGTLWAWRRRPLWGFALAWALLDWVPLYLFLPRLDVANDRQLYLATWPLCLALAVELQQTLPRRIAHPALALLLCAGAALTVLRNQDYHSEIALWEQTAKQSPSKSRVHNNLGYAYMEAGRTAEARQAYLRALQLDAGNIKARLNLRRMNAQAATPSH